MSPHPCGVSTGHFSLLRTSHCSGNSCEWRLHVETPLVSKILETLQQPWSDHTMSGMAILQIDAAGTHLCGFKVFLAHGNGVQLVNEASNPYYCNSRNYLQSLERVWMALVWWWLQLALSHCMSCQLLIPAAMRRGASKATQILSRVCAYKTNGSTTCVLAWDQ